MAGRGSSEISQGQIWRCATWSFGFSILCYILLTLWTRRMRAARTSRLRPYCHFACRLWTSTSLGFATGLIKELMDGMDVDWPWCGPNGLENPCRFEGRVVLVYYESAVVAMILLIAISMTRAYLIDLRMRRPPPCDDTVAMSVDLEFDDVEDGRAGETEKASDEDDDDDDDDGRAPTENTESSVDDEDISLSPHSSAQSTNLSDEAVPEVVAMSDDAVPCSHCPPECCPEASGKASVPLDKQNNVAATVADEDHDDAGGSLDDDDRASIGVEEQQQQHDPDASRTPCTPFPTTTTVSVPIDKDKDAAHVVGERRHVDTDAPRIVGDLLTDAEEGNSGVYTSRDADEA